MQTICLIYGDGIGQEVIPAAIQALQALELELKFVEAPAGFECFKRHGNALPPETLQLAKSASAVLFGATASPSTIVKGYSSPILALRRSLDLYANMRPIYSLPGQFSRPGVDLLIVRENTEGLYSGRERLEEGTAIAERVITRRASERIARVAFEQARRRAARREKPPKVTIVHKANVLKLSDGLFRESVLVVAGEYGEVEVEERLVDAAALQLIQTPQNFDVVVTTNLFGDILSDAASNLMGGLGTAPSANIGVGTPLFEPVHGSAPDISGRGAANPVGAMLSAALMLETLGESRAAARLRGAVVDTIASGIGTADLGGTASTAEFTRAVCRRLLE